MTPLSSSFLLIILVCFSSINSVASNGDAAVDVELLQAAFSNNVEAMASALSRGANPNVRHPGSGQTALMGAVLRGYTDVVKFMLSQEGVNVAIPEKDGYTPAHGAGFQGRADCMRALAETGVNVVDDYHEDGFAPLHRACWGREQRHTETIRVLRDEVGVDIANLAAKNGKRCEDMTTNVATMELLKETKDGIRKEDEL